MTAIDRQMDAPRAAPRPARNARQRKDTRTAFAFLAPFLILLLVFQYVPLAMMAKNAFMDYSLLNPDAAKFVGMLNFEDMFYFDDARESLAATFLFALIVVLIVIPLGFVLALFLNSTLPARALVRTIIMLPVVTSAVVVATMWNFLLDPSNGLINGVIALFGLPRQPFLTSPNQALIMISVMTAWQQVGFATILFLGGLQGVPKELSEAARIDGATRWQVLWNITVPLLSRTTLFVVVIMTVFSLQAFAPAFLMTDGGPNSSTNLIVYHIYKMAFVMQNAGYASALSLVLLLIVLGISLLQMWLLRAKWNY
ncbi:carbohydrate ABC transporter permease [Alloyangia pacifica]|uniref:Multiple sugar transport system permease protein n=1 Tax=Alloyangia pacifica TaxID=311180 RepID=A0A1I6UXZ6_9RHOB|nr:sugar ABC transporter permease [Alloyangia pacifica]SDI30240.1 multiple sugar transport system permease protein [Alloyangia pacifica]SFT06331.1 multiple sugar transport system permease protein [Alloyangia pacifica]